MKAASLVFLALCSVGCGRPATESDCAKIVDRIAVLELERAGVSDPTEREAQITSTRAAFHDRAMKECVGRRITKNALACIETAKNTDAILGECFD